MILSGSWHSWERAAFARQRPWVQIPSAPPNHPKSYKRFWVIFILSVITYFTNTIYGKILIHTSSEV